MKVALLCVDINQTIATLKAEGSLMKRTELKERKTKHSITDSGGGVFSCHSSQGPRCKGGGVPGPLAVFFQCE